MRCILVLDGHPHNDPDHYVHALASAYIKGAEELHEVRRVDLSKLDFPVLRDPDDWNSHTAPQGLAKVQEAMRWADHIVILYPLWLGDVPALLKAMLEQVARPGFAVEPAENGLYRQLLKGKSARLIVTMGMPAAAYSLFFRAHSVKSFKRNILHFAGVSPVRLSLMGSVAKSDDYRKTWLRKVERLGRSGR
ncbi:NAD(P)H-dependent oxidoreductase [Altererythrobacter aquiaggeris]|uniref:NAD(P)H-dependent oxidoreductase n=1 Tax=Aestuarierythrobacter aquiaggeris TaxID=1898396 RepID=UPI00301963B7